MPLSCGEYHGRTLPEDAGGTLTVYYHGTTQAGNMFYIHFLKATVAVHDAEELCMSSGIFKRKTNFKEDLFDILTCINNLASPIKGTI